MTDTVHDYTLEQVKTIDMIVLHLSDIRLFAEGILDFELRSTLITLKIGTQYEKHIILKYGQTIVVRRTWKTGK